MTLPASPCCQTLLVHTDTVETVRGNLPPDELLYDLAELFKTFGDSTRIRILFVLFEAEVCVCDLAQVLNMTQSAVSHQLKILKQNAKDMKIRLLLTVESIYSSVEAVLMDTLHLTNHLHHLLLVQEYVL